MFSCTLCVAVAGAATATAAIEPSSPTAPDLSRVVTTERVAPTAERSIDPLEGVQLSPLLSASFDWDVSDDAVPVASPKLLVEVPSADGSLAAGAYMIVEVVGGATIGSWGLTLTLGY